MAAAPSAASVALMPKPLSVTPGPGDQLLNISGPFAVQAKGCGDSALIQRAADRLQADIGRQTGLALSAAHPVRLSVICRDGAYAAERNEGYRLSVEADGVSVEADGPVGALRGFATLRQLVGLSPDGIRIPLQRIDDNPRFQWRGLLLDPARHFLSLETLKRQIDNMERVKLNTLHLHLSDDQGFRVESKRYPKLNAAGPYYTQAEIRDLVAYAAARGVRIVPEFDVPGHSRAIVDAYPETGVLADTAVPGLKAAALDPSAPATWAFLDRLFGEMTALFPDRHFHAGGDEVTAGIWTGAPKVRAWMQSRGHADQHAAERWFAGRVAALLKRHGKTMIGWEEVAGAGLDREVVVQAWQTSKAMARAIEAGHPVIMSAGYYLNLLMPADWHYAIDPAATAGVGLEPEHAARLRKLSPLLAGLVTDALVDQPMPPLTAAQERLLLGGEMALWGEITTDELVEHQLWPRAAAVAERFWSPRDVTDPADMYHRLDTVAAQLGSNDALVQRLSPHDPATLATLLDAAGPVRNMAHDHRVRAMLAGKPIIQSFNAPADAAPVDSLLAHRFEAAARRYTAGERGLAPALQAQLRIWKENDARFRAAAKGRPLLEAALPTSEQLAGLAAVGLQALAAIEAGATLSADQAAQARAALKRVADQADASWRPFDGFLRPQPPADLLLKVGPGIAALVDAAAPR